MNKKWALSAIMFATLLFFTSGLFAAESEETPLTLEECLALAEANHPSLEEARANLAVQQAKLGQVKADNALTGSLSASTSRESGKEGSYSSSFTISKLLSDSGKNALEQKSQILSIDSSAESQRETILSVRTEVKNAYYGLLLALLKRDQAEDAVKTYLRHLGKAKGFYEAGSKAKFDVTKAEVDLSNAKIDLVSAEAALGTARAALSNAVGVPLENVRPVSDFRPSRPLPDESFALEQAMENRPDIRSARLKSEAGKLGVAIAAKGNAATVSLSGSAKLSGTNRSPNDDFNMSVNLSVPVFDGGLTNYKVSEARSSSKALEAARKKVEQTIRYEVRSSILSVKEAEAKIPTTELLVYQAKENLTLAEGRYETGVGNVLEVADAVLASTSAKISYYEALHDYSVSLAELEKILGGEFE